MQQLLFLFILFIIAGYWVDSVRVKELARAAGKRFCQKNDVQFLDSTVIKQKTRLCRSKTQLFNFERTYHFEYSVVGNERHNGIIIYNGHRLKEIQIDLNTYDENSNRDIDA